MLLASRLGPINLIPPTHTPEEYKTVRQAIGNLPRLRSNGVDPRDRLHQCSGLSKTNLQRIKASRPGGTWRDWSKSVVAKCHRKTNGKTYPSVYGRMSWSEPAPTLTGQFYGFGNGRFGHPDGSVTTDQKVSGSTPDGCATGLQLLTRHQHSGKRFLPDKCLTSEVGMYSSMNRMEKL